MARSVWSRHCSSRVRGRAHHGMGSRLRRLSSGGRSLVTTRISGSVAAKNKKDKVGPVFLQCLTRTLPVSFPQNAEDGVPQTFNHPRIKMGTGSDNG
jgi:hypothetical protein